MAVLASGLPEVVSDDEDLARFLTHRRQFSATGPKPAVFLPNPKDHETSVFRHGSDPQARLWRIGANHVAGERTLYGAAIVRAGSARMVHLEVVAGEPPPRHAAIGGWPLLADDPEAQKAQRKEQATVLASEARLLLREPAESA